MLSNEHQSEQTSRNTSRSEPAPPATATRLNRLSSGSSASEDNYRGTVPAAPPLPPIFGQSNVTPSETPSESVNSTPTPDTYRPPVRTVRTPPPAKFFQAKPLRPSNSSETSGRVQPTKTRTAMETKPKTTLRPSGSLTRVSARDIENEKYPTISKLVSTPLTRGGKSHQSIFEKVDIRNRRTSFLGSGTYSQLEDCIKDCLARDSRHPQTHHSASRYHSPLRSLTRASVLEDYSYDGIVAPNYHYVPRSRSRYHDLDYPYAHHHHHYHHTKSPVDLSLTEIRHVNDALAKYGISVFSHEDHHHHHAHRPNQPVGNIISACQLLINDPTLAAYRNGSSAVHNVWDHVTHPPAPPYSGGYGSQPGQGGAPPFFNRNNPPQNAPSNPFYPPQAPPYPPTNQPPNNAGRNVLANLFGQPQQSSYPPPPPPMNQPPNTSGGNVLANLFGQPQQSSYPPPPPPPPMNQPPNNSGRNVLASLFGQPQQNPNNNYRPY